MDAREGEAVWGYRCGEGMELGRRGSRDGSLAQNAACVAVPATTYQVTNTPQIRAPGRLDPVRRQVKVAMTAAIASSGTNWMAMMVESGTKPGSGSGLNSCPVSHNMPYCKPSSTMKPSVSARILVR